MKNILIIVANPKLDSLSFIIANKYKSLQDESSSIEILDLYRDENKQDFFTYEDASNRVVTKEMLYYQEKISAANEIVLVFPYWWGSYPAILKNFFDWNLSSGYAYKYEKNMPLGLLKNKSVKVFTTTSAPKFYYFFTGANRRLKNMIKEQIINFCGMDLVSFNVFGSVRANTDNAQKILNKIK